MDVDKIMQLSLDERIVFLERLFESLSETDAEFALVVRLLEKSREEKSREVQGVQASIDRVVKESSQAKESGEVKGSIKQSSVEDIAKTAPEVNKSDEKSPNNYRGLANNSESTNRYESKPYERKDPTYKKEEPVDEAKKKADHVHGYARRS